MFSKGNSIKKYMEHAVLIGPNLGKPQILSFPKQTKDNLDTFQVELLFITSNKTTGQEFLKDIEEQIKIRPIIKLDNKTKRGIRGEAIIGRIITISKTPILPLEDSELILNYNHESPREIPVKERIYDEKNTYFLAIMEFKFTSILKEIMDQDGFVLCDLCQNFPNEENLNKINYHSVVLTNQSWENCTIIHASDLHIAKRNDEILPFLLKRLDKSLTKKILDIYDFFSKNKIDSIEKRFINPNNNFRLFIKLMNFLKEKKEVDAIILTGDIIDFCIRSDGGESIVSFDLPNTNWKVFLNIILNRPITYRRDIGPINIFPSEELMVPIFTITGNHDYRAYHYDIKWGTLHKIVNMRSMEILHYQDVIPANPISALFVSRKTMTGYDQSINPYQNYWVRLGDHLLIMLDTGSDSAKATRDLLMGDPSSIGFSDEQFKFMENVMKIKSNVQGMRMAFFHAPVLNPLPLSLMNKKLRDEYKKYGLNEIKDFYEDNLNKILDGDARSDYYINYKYGCIMNNWENSLKFFNDNKFLVINGHTHYQFEARTTTTDSPSEITSSKFLVAKDDIKVPVSIYIDNYSEKYKSHDQIIPKLPFHLQTPSLGVGNYGEFNAPTVTTGAFRILKIEDNKLHSFEVDYITNYTKLLLLSLQ